MRFKASGSPIAEMPEKTDRVKLNGCQRRPKGKDFKIEELCKRKWCSLDSEKKESHMLRHHLRKTRSEKKFVDACTPCQKGGKSLVAVAA